MIETILISTTVFFSAQLLFHDCKFPHFSCETKCHAYEEVRGWEWSKWEPRKNYFLWRSDYEYKLDEDNNLEYQRSHKILWTKLIGLCDDGVVRWQDEREIK